MKSKLILSFGLLLFSFLPTATTFSSNPVVASTESSMVLLPECEQNYLYDHFLVDMWYENTLVNCGNNYSCRDAAWWTFITISGQLLDEYMDCMYGWA